MRRVATTYTRRGARVLLLGPPAPEPSHAHAGRPAETSLPALMAAAQMLARLGRPTHVRTLASFTRSADCTAPQAAGESGSGPSEPRLVVPTPLDVAADHQPDRPGQSVGVTGEPDRYALLITHLDPHRADWATSVPWAHLMSPHGILAAITHSDLTREWHSNISRLLTHITGPGRLALLDRIALLAAPAHTAPSTPADPGTRRAHTELLLFAHRDATAHPRKEMGR